LSLVRVLGLGVCLALGVFFARACACGGPIPPPVPVPEEPDAGRRYTPDTGTTDAADGGGQQGARIDDSACDPAAVAARVAAERQTLVDGLRACRRQSNTSVAELAKVRKQHAKVRAAKEALNKEVEALRAELHRVSPPPPAGEPKDLLDVIKRYGVKPR